VLGVGGGGSGCCAEAVATDNATDNALAASVAKGLRFVGKASLLKFFEFTFVGTRRGR
jgi:hypothetical protein